MCFFGECVYEGESEKESLYVCTVYSKCVSECLMQLGCVSLDCRCTTREVETLITIATNLCERLWGWQTNSKAISHW